MLFFYPYPRLYSFIVTLMMLYYSLNDKLLFLLIENMLILNIMLMVRYPIHTEMTDCFVYLIQMET